jgi:hypothetical protein
MCLLPIASHLSVPVSLQVSGGRLKKNIRLIHWGQQVHGVSFKKRAPRAIKEIRGFAEKAMVSEAGQRAGRMALYVLASSSNKTRTGR